MSKTGYGPEMVNDAGDIGSKIRYYYSTTYDAGTNESTIRIYPELYYEVLWGSEVIMTHVRKSYGTMENAGIRVDGSTLWALDSDHYLYNSSGDWGRLTPNTGAAFTFTKTHDNNGDVTFNAGIVGACEGYGSDQSVYEWPTGRAITIHEDKTLRVTYNANNGTGAPSATYFYGTTESITLSSTKPTRTGYTFDSWNTKADGTGTKYAAGASIGTLDDDLTLYAQWNIITYTVSYNANGGTGAPSSQTKTYGKTLTLSSTKPTKANTTPSPASYTVTYKINYTGGTDPAAATAARTTKYTFSKWKATDGTLYNSGGSYTKNEDTTMTAQWSSSTTTAAVTLPTRARTGYTFKGWATSSTATSGVTGSYTPTGDVTLYAVWAINSYTLTLAKGDYISSVSGGGSKNYKANVTAKAVLGSATGYTYSFTGWYDGTTKKSSSLSYDFTMPAGDLTLTAKGSRTANTYTVKFNANRGASASGGGTMADESFTYNVSKALTANAFTRYFTITFDANGGTGVAPSVNVPSRFSGWATTSSGSVVYADGESVKNLTSTNGGSVTLYARWINATHVLPTPTKVGYTFDGWYTAAVGGTKVSSNYTPTSSITLYAHWSVVTYTLSMTSSDNGVVVNVIRTASPYGGGATGLLGNGAVLFYGDALTISYAIGEGYQKKEATINGVDFGEDYSGSQQIASVQGNIVVVVLVKLGAIVYIGNEAYQVFIGAADGSAYAQYEAFIGSEDGTTWVPY